MRESTAGFKLVNEWLTSTSKVILMFMLLLLQGFKALQGSTGAAGPRLFTIHQVDACTDNLPKAHTW